MVRQAKERYPAARIVLLADHFDPGTVMQGREAGVNSFCLTGSSREVLITSLELVMLGESMLPGAAVRSIIDSMALSPEPEAPSETPAELKVSHPGVRSLSAREAEILTALMEGTPNKLIARQLHVTEATVKVHVKAVLRKIGVSNRTQAAMWAKGHLHG
jgi:two-component system nitrate/nitrite response regulator NarL